VTVADIEDILRAEPDVVLFGQGDPGRMMPVADLIEHLAKSGIEPLILPTAAAAEAFNRLVETNRKVAAGFHLTCLKYPNPPNV